MATGRVNVGGGGAALNIFTQLSEPPAKEGIWLKTADKYSKVVVDDEVVMGGNWIAHDSSQNIPGTFENGRTVRIGADIFLFGVNQAGLNDKTYRYNALDGTYTQLSNLPYTWTTQHRVAVVAVGIDVYLFIPYTDHYDRNRTRIIKYDTITDTYSLLEDSSLYFANTIGTAHSTDIYLFGEGAGTATAYNVYKYDTLANTFTQLSNKPNGLYRVYRLSKMGTDIYLFGEGNGGLYNSAYKYDILSDTYIQLPNTPVRNVDGVSVAIGTDIFLLGGSNVADRNASYKYDTISKTYTQLGNIPYPFYRGQAEYFNDKIYCFGSWGSGYRNYLQIYALETKQYDEKSLVLIRTNDAIGVYYTELVSPLVNPVGDQYTRLATGFNDAFLFVDGELTSPPAYYGDGEQWIKFRE